MPALHRSKQVSGFTLIELMVAIGILAVLVSLGIPSFNSFIQKTRLEAAVSDLSDALKYARSEAIQRNTTIDVDPEDAGYSAGWVVEDDALNPPELLRVHDQSFHSDISLVCGGIDCDETLEFTGRGTATSASFTLKHKVSGDTRYICVMLSGNVRVSSSACP